jgi:PAS domain S-box-containing protein
MLAAIGLTLAIPATYASFAIHTTQIGLALDTAHAALALDQIVVNRTELWMYEVLRIQELIDRPSVEGLPEDRVVLTLHGQEVAHSGFRAPSPVIVRRVPIHDSGRVVGIIEARRSIRQPLVQTLWVALAGTALCWGLFTIFRLLPIRILGQAIADLADERSKFAATLRAIPDGIIAADGEDFVMFMNPAAGAFLGCSPDSAMGHPLSEVYPVVRTRKPGSESEQGRAELHLPGTPLRILEERFSPLPMEWSGRAGRVIVFRDITAQLKTEAELLRVRQVESLGVLAGGIAHDFNNYLSAVLGNISLARQDLPEGRSSRRLAEAMKATERARALTLKLLTFAKGGDPARQVVDLAPLVQEAASFALRGTAAQADFTFQAGLWNAEVDEGLLSQVIHNLVINAVQAMQGQGQIRIRVENLQVGADEVLQLQPGRYLRVSIQDTGPGILEAVLPRIFEPYFTTKASGNGLGLASCYNIMKAHGGKIVADSTPGSGALFLLYVPATDCAVDSSPVAPPALLPQGRGRILVMEDDPVLLEIASEMLDRLGFTAHTCANGESAISAYTKSLESDSPFLAVIMDLTIAGGMGGREAAARILALDPDANLIVSSGYSVDPIMAHPAEFGFKSVLPKPYSLMDLGKVLGEVVRY